MDDISQALVHLNGVPHRLSTVLQKVKLAPIVTIKVEDIHPLPHCGGPAETLVRHHPETPEALEREIVFFKQHGGYTILLGRKKFEAEGLRKVTEAEAQELRKSPREVRGRLISTPMLKKCRLDNEAQPEAMEEVRPLDRGARTYHRDNDYRGNRIELPASAQRARQFGYSR